MAEPLRVLEFITGLPVEAGTTTFFVEICNRLSDCGCRVTAAVLPLPHSLDFAMFRKEVTLLTIVPILRGDSHYVTFGRDQPDNPMSQPLDFSSPHFDVVHIHGVWSPTMHRVAVWARKWKIPVVWSPHGMLTPWALSQGALKKKLLWLLFQKQDLQLSDCIHATAESEVEDVRRLGIRAPVSTIPLGVEPTFTTERLLALKQSHVGNQIKTLLFVSRVQKKKGLPNLIHAWSMLRDQKKTIGWHVRVVGPDQDGHVSELTALCRRLKCLDDFTFVGPLHEEALQLEYVNADLFVLPTLSENFGSVVIESLACATPVITTEGAPWKELVGQGCGWWVKTGVDPLVRSLSEAMSLSPQERLTMGVRGRNWVERTYTWSAVVEQLKSLYERIKLS